MKKTNPNSPRQQEIARRTATVFRLAQKYGWVCWYCNLPLNPNQLQDAKRRNSSLPSTLVNHYQMVQDFRNIEIHLDHIIPRCRGGDDGIDNLALACEFCNLAKSDLDVELYLIWLDRIRFGEAWSPIRDGRK